MIFTKLQWLCHGVRGQPRVTLGHNGQIMIFTKSHQLVYYPRGPLVLKLDIILVKKKIHIIRVVFQDQEMYPGSSFRGAKHVKLEKKVCFWS